MRCSAPARAQAIGVGVSRRSGLGVGRGRTRPVGIHGILRSVADAASAVDCGATVGVNSRSVLMSHRSSDDPYSEDWTVDGCFRQSRQRRTSRSTTPVVRERSPGRRQRPRRRRAAHRGSDAASASEVALGQDAECRLTAGARIEESGRADRAPRCDARLERLRRLQRLSFRFGNHRAVRADPSGGRAVTSPALLIGSQASDDQGHQAASSVLAGRRPASTEAAAAGREAAGSCRMSPKR